ncbi:hypothetical protein [Tengunoibacter tsumagoiensis]|uniref:Uncharacterized protein n=1 Tax=Tengunoibacter tsumagoiensis TaxID=2014871 RepID=A0A402A6P5_9CHLR|nr:hypothetical protein [Tengunoibacter tsumagoiensis]GCE14804.1 hypothetical protein KTT_46630 [Tengunoibacter tsumagoiensis]
MAYDQQPTGWNKQASQLASVTDLTGKSIDPGILETVIALNLLGVETTSSCEGHLDHGTPAPWVDFHAVGTEEIRHQANIANKQLQDAEEQHASREILHTLTETIFRLAHEEQKAILSRGMVSSSGA